MTRAHLADPQPVVSDRLRARLEARLAARGITAEGPAPADVPEPIPAAATAQKRFPFDYRNAVADHPDVLAWVRTVVDAAVAPNSGGLYPNWGGAGRRQIAHGPSLLLWGPTGTGKTHQAYGAIRALILAGCGVRWHATTLADLYAETRPRPGADPEFLLRRIVRVPLLLLDDLGAAKATEWTEELNFRLLNWRAENRLPTIVTSNLSPIRSADVRTQPLVLRDKVGDRVLSRLSGMCTSVEFSGPDRRFPRR
ncbi:ATP-binding protein [Streptomyces sp. NPDC006923]|uniref:ATP-binding protein n=1 Tax=Streptomyces sp. NPDC006923 TaxID=3155355 RepID=UPI00341120F8